MCALPQRALAVTLRILIVCRRRRAFLGVLQQLHYATIFPTCIKKRRQSATRKPIQRNNRAQLITREGAKHALCIYFMRAYKKIL